MRRWTHDEITRRLGGSGIPEEAWPTPEDVAELEEPPRWRVTPSPVTASDFTQPATARRAA